MKRTRREFLAGAAAGAALLGGIGPSQAAGADAVIAGAKSEKGLVWYDHYDHDEVQAIFKAFRAAYPTVQGAEFIDVPSAQKIARIMQESMAGGPTSDIIFLEVNGLQSLSDRGFLTKSNWASLGAPASATTTPNDSMVLVTTAIYVILYNTKIVPDAEAPKSWDEVVDPKWTGRTGHWLRAPEFPQLLAVLGEEKVRDLAKKMSAQKPRMFDGLFPLAQAIGSGELSVCVTSFDSARRVIESGAPVKMVPLDVTPANLLYGGVLKHGQSPNTAQLFLSWLATKNGGLIFEEMTRRGNLFIPESKTAEFLKGRKVSFFDPAQAIKDTTRLNRLEAEISKMLQGRG